MRNYNNDKFKFEIDLTFNELYDLTSLLHCGLNANLKTAPNDNYKQRYNELFEKLDTKIIHLIND